MSIRVGLAGKRAADFVPALKAIEGVEARAICELDVEVLRRLAERHEIPIQVARFEDLLQESDAVIVGTPMHLHVQQSVQALGAGVHVLSEVTAAVSIEECQHLHRAALASSASYMLSENYCFTPEAALVRAMARKGLFGELYYGEGEYVHDVKDMHRFPDGSPTWRATWQVGLRGCTYGTHSLGPVMRWFKAADPRERIETVSCFGSGVHTDPERPHDDTCLMICQLASGKLVKVRLDMMSNRPHRMQTYELQGTRGVYESGRGDGEPGRIWIGENRYEANRAWTPISAFCDHLPPEYRDPDESSRAAGHGGGDYYVIQAWLRSIRSGGPPPIGIDDALEWTAAGLCSQESILQGGLPVKVPRFG